MEPTNLLIVGAVILIGGYILLKVASKIIKTVLTLALVGLAIYFWQGGTVDGLKSAGVKTLFNKKTTISGLLDQHCSAQKAEKVKCLCIAEPVYADLTSRLSGSDISAIDQDSDRVQEEIRTSLKNKQKEIRNCLVKNKGSQYMEALKDVAGKVKEAAE